MIKVLISIFLCLSKIAFSQLEDLRLILPVGHTDAITEIKISHNGQYIATANTVYAYFGGNMDDPTDHNVIIWNTRGIPLHVLPHDQELSDISGFSYDDSLIQTIDEEYVYVWNVGNGKLVKKYDLSSLNEIGELKSSFGLERVCESLGDSEKFCGYGMKHFASGDIIEFDEYGGGYGKCANSLKWGLSSAFLDSILIQKNQKTVIDSLLIKELKLSQYGTIGPLESNENLIFTMDDSFIPDPYGGHDLVIYSRNTKTRTVGKNKSIAIDHFIIDTKNPIIAFEAKGRLNQIDLSNLKMSSVRFLDEYSIERKHFLFKDSISLVFDYGFPIFFDLVNKRELLIDFESLPKGIKKQLRSESGVCCTRTSSTSTPARSK